MGRGLWDMVKSGFNAAKDYVKDNRLISKGIRMIPGKYSKPLAAVAGAAGYGRRRKRAPVMGMGRRRRVGAGLWDTLKSGFNAANDFVKQNRLLSRGIRMIPGQYSKPLANLAGAAGYGRKRARVGGRIIMPAYYSTGLGGLAATA
jgi:hypothetical protein